MPDADYLHFRKPDREALVRVIIDGGNNGARNRMATVPIVVFRYRNNLPRCEVAVQARGQLGNFVAANNILMKVLKLHGALADG
ncbi:hypothetical protein NKI15_02825 [Mesorhizobium sp. M0862]|uniref:hypothetical protein n=1 Tax=Mesorhizobium sp. M0862 TaxID=2957015 RepID=UPI00333CD9C6